jgi:hypothetical protein
LSDKNPFHFYSTDDRVATFGRRKHREDWEGPQTARELYVLGLLQPGPKVGFAAYATMGCDSSECQKREQPPRLEDRKVPDWVEDELRLEVCAARDRAFRIRRQIVDMEELLRLYDKYGLIPKGLQIPTADVREVLVKLYAGPADCEHLDPADDREKLREIRFLVARISQSDVQPTAPVIESLPMAAAPVPNPDPSLASAKVEIEEPIATRSHAKRLGPRKGPVVRALKEMGIHSKAELRSKADTVGSLEQFAAELAPATRGYDDKEATGRVHALRKMLSTLADDDFAAVK